MKVRLLKDIVEYDRRGESVGIKTIKKHNPKWGPPIEAHGQFVKSLEPEFITTEFKVGLVVEVSEATGEKWVEAGIAEFVSFTARPIQEKSGV